MAGLPSDTFDTEAFENAIIDSLDSFSKTREASAIRTSVRWLHPKELIALHESLRAYFRKLNEQEDVAKLGADAVRIFGLRKDVPLDC